MIGEVSATVAPDTCSRKNDMERTPIQALLVVGDHADARRIRERLGDEASAPCAVVHVPRFPEALDRLGDHPQDGSRAWTLENLSLREDDGGNLVIQGVFVHAAGRTHFEKATSRRPGPAHEFNNLLTVIRGFSELLLCSLQPEDAIRRYAEEIRNAADRATMLIARSWPPAGGKS
jgi:signal transduction histidine kinase